MSSLWDVVLREQMDSLKFPFQKLSAEWRSKLVGLLKWPETGNKDQRLGPFCFSEVFLQDDD